MGEQTRELYTARVHISMEQPNTTTTSTYLKHVRIYPADDEECTNP